MKERSKIGSNRRNYIKTIDITDTLRCLWCPTWEREPSWWGSGWLKEKGLTYLNGDEDLIFRGGREGTKGALTSGRKGTSSQSMGSSWRLSEKKDS
ncbi:hypothetical protein TNIN_86901 [Trichonephila inaurata madagascariensis]|uniref:Uncharacterized protein n=1 Tax=Trichonephila inaurata madagascariensis TaxID=2747483 RepID=A0A8X6Y603_9ARAC|nr:hypothetical protein TNIN_86901 [Trichonephila inaurata madagascariensis]